MYAYIKNRYTHSLFSPAFADPSAFADPPSSLSPSALPPSEVPPSALPPSAVPAIHFAA